MQLTAPANWSAAADLGVGRTTEGPVTPQPDDDSTEFLNVDLEVFSRQRLAVFVSGLGRSVHVLHEGRWGRRRYAACLELWTSGYGQTPDQIIQRMVRLLKKMPPSAKHLWNGAQARRFNIGIQAAFKPRSFQLPLRPATVKAIADVGAQLLITVYAPEPLQPSSNETPPNNAADGRREEAPTQRQAGRGRVILRRRPQLISVLGVQVTMARRGRPSILG